MDRNCWNHRGRLCDSLAQNVRDDLAVVDIQSFPSGNFELPKLQPKQMQDRCVQIGHVMSIS